MTKDEILAELKVTHPTLRTGSDEDGYIDLSKTDYEAKLSEWADNLIIDAAKKVEEEAVAQAKLDAITKLTALGIDPKAFGLVIEETPVEA